MASPEPRVSVIVPVRDRCDLLARLLDALDAQTLAEHEVVVVDDGSTDGSAAVARARAAAGRPVVVLDGGGRGAVEARTIGVGASRAPVLAFTDSDCEPAPDWLERGLERILDGADVVVGRTIPTRAVGPLERTVWVTRDDGLYATCNVLYRRAAFDDAGGFDATAGARIGFRPGRRLRDLGFGEDTLLGWRVRRAGRSVYAPEVVVRHAVFEPNAREYVTRGWNAGGFPALVREVPELRDTFLEHQLLLGSSTRVPLYAGALLALSGQRRLAAVAAAAWVVSNVRMLARREGGWKRRLAALPVVLAHDGVTAASLLTGSARAGTVVL